MADFIRKEENIIKKLQETDFALFDHDKEEAFEFLTNSLDAFPNYCNTVISQQIRTPIVYAQCEGEDLRQRIMQLDTTRRNAHERAITAFNSLNILSERLGLEPFTSVNTKDRYAVQDEVANYVNEVYNQGTGKTTFDDMTYKKTKPYPTNTRNRLQQFNEHISFHPDEDEAKTNDKSL